jgi:hypothetical protein
MRQKYGGFNCPEMEKSWLRMYKTGINGKNDGLFVNYPLQTFPEFSQGL